MCYVCVSYSPPTARITELYCNKYIYLLLSYIFILCIYIIKSNGPLAPLVRITWGYLWIFYPKYFFCNVRFEINIKLFKKNGKKSFHKNSSFTKTLCFPYKLHFTKAKLKRWNVDIEIRYIVVSLWFGVTCFPAVK
jgi:hypothetical protein